VKQTIGVLACVASLAIFSACTSEPPPIPQATVQVGQSGRCGATHGAFVETGKMVTPRALHTATVLEDGTVLIAGGASGSQPLDSSEIFDPASGAFLPSGTMTVARQQAVAVRLSDGRVLIAGGFARLTPFVAPLDTAEIYDPRSRTFSAIGSIGFADIASSSTFPGGIVLRVATQEGFDVTRSATLLDGGTVLLIDNDSARLFNSDKGTFAPAAKPVVRRYQSTAAKLSDGRVLIACGGAGPISWKSAEIYDPKSGQFMRTGDMLEPLFSCHAALLPDGHVLLTGTSGGDFRGEVYDPKTGAFSSAGKLPFRLEEPVPSRLSDGRVLVTGLAKGLTAEIFDWKSNAFESIGAILPGRSEYTSTTLLDGSILIAGGGSDFLPPSYPDTSLLYCP
jgi:Galactose oxidase, central domain/Kelch motif